MDDLRGLCGKATVPTEKCERTGRDAARFRGHHGLDAQLMKQAPDRHCLGDGPADGVEVRNNLDLRQFQDLGPQLEAVTGSKLPADLERHRLVVGTVESLESSAQPAVVVAVAATPIPKPTAAAQRFIFTAFSPEAE